MGLWPARAENRVSRGPYHIRRLAKRYGIPAACFTIYTKYVLHRLTHGGVL